MRYGNKSVKLQDCRFHGAGSDAELFLVEGDSAADSVTSLRNPQTQAVLPMQGKPLNAIKASAARVGANTLFRALIDAIGAGVGDRFSVQQCRYERLILLFDPDADGIHSGALMLMFFHRFMPALLDGGQLLMVRAPLFRVTCPALDQVFYAASETHLEHINKQLKASNSGSTQILRYRGLGSLEPALLTNRCIDPQTRQADAMTHRDAEMAMQVFGS